MERQFDVTPNISDDDPDVKRIGMSSLMERELSMDDIVTLLDMEPDDIETLGNPTFDICRIS